MPRASAARVNASFARSPGAGIATARKNAWPAANVPAVIGHPLEQISSDMSRRNLD
jgi:hypothetical protein